MRDREVYIEKLTNQLKEWDAEIKKLEAKAATVKAEAKLEYEQWLRDLKIQQDEARHKVEKLKQAGEETWTELKSGTEAVFGDLKNTYEGVVSKLKGGSD